MLLAFSHGGIKAMNPSTGVLTVDLVAVQENWRQVNLKLSGTTTAAAVIKANAYGLGASQVGPALYSIGCREFFVATLEEGLAAREYLPLDAVIYVLGGARPGIEEIFIQHSLRPVLFTLSDINRWQQVSAQQKTPACCAIKIDTGMTRLGLDEEEFLSLCQTPNSFDHLAVVLVMSHLACADEPEHPLNLEQLTRFQRLVIEAKKVLPSARFSLANSSGIFLGTEWHFDLVRPGAALYGINPQPSKISPLVPVVKLELPILQLRTIERSVSVGYGATAQLASPARVLVVAGGYADGLHRTIGRNGVGELEGQLLPVIGRISMDTTMFDASALLDTSSLGSGLSVEGAMLTVLNARLTVDYLMRHAQALGYEVLTSLGARYSRRYLVATSTSEL
jgi:alanine racemase